MAFDYSDDYIFASDLQTRLDELYDDRAALVEDVGSATESGDEESLSDAIQALSEFDEESTEEIEMLEEIKSEVGRGFGDECIIAEDKFTDHIREIAEDCGDVSRDLPAYIEIDWEKTAENCKCDYSTVEIEGNTYYFIYQ